MTRRGVDSEMQLENGGGPPTLQIEQKKIDVAWSSWSMVFWRAIVSEGREERTSSCEDELLCI